MEKTFAQEHQWVNKAVALLSFNGGLVNAITFISLFQRPVGYVTGNIALAASAATELNTTQFIDLIAAIMFFLLGSILSGMIIPHNSFDRNSKYNLAIILETCFIFFGMLGLLLDITSAKYLLAIALGVQNALTTYYGRSIIRTTHMTGTMTDLGILIGHRLKGHKVQSWRFKIYLFLILGFFIGSICGILSFKLLGFYSLLISIFICMVMLKFTKS